MTVPGIDATVALSIVAAVGDFTRFRTPDKLVAYLGLNPRVRQSGGQPASHGRITKAGSAHARGMLVEAAWSASKAAGPLRAFYQRVQARRGMQIAVVATARKLTVLCWHLIISGEDYAYAQPSLVAHKRRKLELRAGLPSARGQKGKSAGYSLQAVRAAERDLAAQAEVAVPQAERRRAHPLPARPRPAGPVPAGRGWTWPPPLGRDFRGPLRATRRGRADSPTPCTSRRGRTTSTAAERYAGPRHGQGRSSSLRCGRSTLTPAPGRRSQAAATNGGKTAPTYTNPARPSRGLTISSVVRR
jgi:hypothetical protein